MNTCRYPIARNSLWESAFGVGFDQALRWHRALGALAWVAVSAHMLLWLIKWAREGTLGANVVAVQYLRVSPRQVCP